MYYYHSKTFILSHAWWNLPVTLALGRLRQEGHKFKASLGYIVRPYLTKSNIF
jgi:hypothetical protein